MFRYHDHPLLQPEQVQIQPSPEQRSVELYEISLELDPESIVALIDSAYLG